MDYLDFLAAYDNWEDSEIEANQRGVCSECQQQGIELDRRKGYAVLVDHDCAGKYCKGSGMRPEVIYNAE